MVHSCTIHFLVSTSPNIKILSAISTICIWIFSLPLAPKTFLQIPLTSFLHINVRSKLLKGRNRLRSHKLVCKFFWADTYTALFVEQSLDFLSYIAHANLKVFSLCWLHLRRRADECLSNGNHFVTLCKKVKKLLWKKVFFLKI